MLMYYAFTPDSVFKLVPPNGSEPTWQTSMLYSDIVLLVYVYETICMIICPLQDSNQSFYGPGYLKMHLMDEGPGAILSFKTFLSFINRLLVTYITSSWRLAWGGTLSAPFWGLCHKLSLFPLYFNKTLLLLIKLFLNKTFITQKLWAIKPHLWPQIEFFSRDQESCRLFSFNNNLSVSGINAIYDKSTATTVISGKEVKTFPLRLGTRQECTLITFIQHIYEVLAMTITEE